MGATEVMKQGLTSQAFRSEAALWLLCAVQKG